MNVFDEYLFTWWQGYVEEHKSDSKRLMELFIGEEETVEDYLEDGETPFDWLCSCEFADEIYRVVFVGSGACCYFDDMPSTEQFLTDVFSKYLDECMDGKFEFAKELVADMAYYASEYECPLSFFEDLQKGGCSSGMIGMFIYYSDCLKFYEKYANEMEEYREYIEEEIGPIKRDKGLPRYNWMCWLCYEELAYGIATYLFDGKF